MCPVVHLNGTGRKTLLAELELACSALTTAETAVRALTVHQRDFYPYPGGGVPEYEAAVRQQQARLKALEAIRNQLLQCLLAF